MRFCASTWPFAATTFVLVGRDEVLAIARWAASTGVGPNATQIASRLGCDPSDVEDLVGCDVDLRDALKELESVADDVRTARRVDSRPGSIDPAVRPPWVPNVKVRRPAWDPNVSQAELSARRMYGAEQNPAEDDYADYGLPGNMASGGGNKGGYGSRRQ